MSEHILIIEDDIDIANIERDYLMVAGYDVTVMNNGTDGIEAALNTPVDLIILDVMLPEMDGFEVCRAIRDKVRVPIVMVTARLDDIDKIRGLGVGADDYIEKPFSPSVLIAKIKAMLAQYKRLTEKDVVDTNAIQSGDIRLDPKMMKVWVFSKEELYSRVWGLDSYGDYATVAVHINRLREEIEENPSDSKHIITVWGVGYKFV